MNKQVCGIYCIENTINNKKYIGSSKTIAQRFKKHICYLTNNTHVNKHLQSACNKYGLSSFNFYIIEECDKQNLFEREQHYIDMYSWNDLYNQTKIAGKGGSDVQRLPLFLLDLKGNIVKKFLSGCDLSDYLGITFNYAGKNTKRVTKKQYRVVTPDFYENHLDIILSWNNYSNKFLHKKSLEKPKQYIVVYYNEEHICKTIKQISDIIGLTSQRTQQIVMSMSKKSLNKFTHKTIPFTIYII